LSELLYNLFDNIHASLETYGC